MPDVRLSTLSREYVRVQVSATEAGSPVNPTADTVQMAVTAAGVDPTTEWATASWETEVTATGTKYYARIQVGPSSTVGQLAVGNYEIWVKVTDNPEVPVAQVGRLAIY